MPDLKRVFGISFGICLLLECLKLTPPYLLKLAVDQLLVPEATLGGLFLPLLGVLIASVLVTYLEQGYFEFLLDGGFRIESSLLKQLHEKLLSLGIRFHEENPSGELEHTLKTGAERFRDLIWFTQERFLGALLQVSLTCLVLLFLDPGAGLIYLLFIPLVIYMNLKASVRLQPYRRTYHDALKNASWTLSQSLRNIRTVKDFVQENAEMLTLRGQLDTYYELAVQRTHFERANSRLQQHVLSFARISLLSFAVYRVHTGAISPGTLVMFITLSEKVIASIFRLGRLYDHLGDARMSVLQMLELFEHEPDFVDASDARSVGRLHGQIQFQDVTFCYPGTVESVVKNIQLDIPSRSTVALVGRSGAGKTTLVKLLLRHYDVKLGSILVDGVDIRRYKIANYRKNIAVVSQDVEVFDRTIRENICYGNDMATEEDVIQAAQSAYAHEFITRLPQGYHTRVGERGFKLSGGQRQRLGIARALLLRPAILIFDEATSSLDTESEQLIQKALLELGANHTLVVVAHRLSTIRSADWVVVLDKGQVVEAGQHDILMSQQGIFRHMQNLQTEGSLRA
ncbi:MAG: ABC transporter ATP-binding protein/permease [Myxococcales bacterium]|nr:ABC transporter ATP-binding protein/permease [Myxococcales bacterium]